MPHPARRPASVAVSPNLIVGLDLAHAEYQAVVLAPTGERRTRFRVPHSRAGIAELLRRTAPRTCGHAGGRVFAFEATGHVWEALAQRLLRRLELHGTQVVPLVREMLVSRATP